MGEEFCKGCQDCTNFNNNEGNLSHFANKPVTNLKNPFFANGTIDNSLINKTDFQNDTSFLTKDYNNNNLNNPTKNETLQISSFKSKGPDDIAQNNLNNQRFYKDESENFFKNMNNIMSKEESYLNNSYNNDNNNMNLYNNNNNSISNYGEEEIDKDRLNEIIKNYSSKIITKNFKQFIKNKNESHKTLYTEYVSVEDSDYVQNNLRNELDVNLIPDKKYLYIGTKFNNKKDGLGLEIYPDSQAKYFGRFINGKRVWAGKFVINNDDYSYYYYGEIKGFYADGFGWHENIKEQVYYEGMWKNSKKEGYGIEKYNKDNSIYKGYFSNGRKNGIGYYKWDDNSNYMGEWSGGTLNGYGIYHFADGSVYTGEWVNNKMDGLGEFSIPEIKIHFGYFEKDQRSGFAITIWYKENKAYIGFWKKNKQEGFGKFICNGKIKYGLWENGKLKQKFDNEDNFISQLQREQDNYLHFFKYNDFESILKRLKEILSL
jgi:hypothetical protein